MFDPQQGTVEPPFPPSAPAGAPELPPSHPLFPEIDGAPPDRCEIKYIGFQRRNEDGRTAHAPEDVPAHEVLSWATVQGWWGGGEYKAAAKDEHHRVIRHFPPAPGEFHYLEGDPKPLLPRAAATARVRPAPAIAPAMSQAPAPAAQPPPSAMEAILARLVNRLDKLEDKLEASRAPANTDGALAALITSQATANASIMTGMLEHRTG